MHMQPNPWARLGPGHPVEAAWTLTSEQLESQILVSQLSTKVSVGPSRWASHRQVSHRLREITAPGWKGQRGQLGRDPLPRPVVLPGAPREPTALRLPQSLTWYKVPLTLQPGVGTRGRRGAEMPCRTHPPRGSPPRVRLLP